MKPAGWQAFLRSRYELDPLLLAGYVLIVIAVALACLRLAGWQGRVLAIAVILLALPGGYLIHRHIFYTPDPNPVPGAQENSVEGAMAALPVWQVLKEQEPTRWAALRQQAVAMEQAGRSQQEIIDAIQPQILAIQVTRLQQASDADVVAYMQANLQQTALIQQQSEDACFRFLFPGVRGGINPTHLLPPEVVQRRMEVDATMMRSARGPDKHTVSDAERKQAEADIVPVVAALKVRYGDKVALLATPQQANGEADEAALCDMTQELWRQVVMLSVPRAAGVIRLSVDADQQMERPQFID